MGMYDYLRVDMPLPDDPPPPKRRDEFQTKDTDAQWCETYTITSDGRLVHHTVRYEETPKEERAYPHAEEGSLQSIIGIIRSVPTGDVEIPFHGDLNFCTIEGRTYWDYTARFTEGLCVHITCDECHPLGDNVLQETQQ